ncbi:MAG: GtrA family protein [Lachnospiraceae bacterium]|nr:GtrA family protein [Lachnospiraceae bacterium]
MEDNEITKGEKRKKLIAQIMKFGVVGGLSFVIDFVITMIVSAICRGVGMDVAIAATVGGVFGFCISLVFNYFMSMKFVFERKDDMDRRKEFIIFAILSLIGLGINSLIMYFGVHAYTALVAMIGESVPAIVSDPKVITAVVKMFATGVVMVYNFISRKMTLEKK